MATIEDSQLRDGSIDAGLSVLLELTPRGDGWTQAEIAIVCGCSKGYIYYLERRGMEKLKTRFEDALPDLKAMNR